MSLFTTVSETIILFCWASQLTHRLSSLSILNMSLVGALPGCSDPVWMNARKGGVGAGGGRGQEKKRREK